MDSKVKNSYCSIESQFVTTQKKNTFIEQKSVFKDIENNEKAINQTLTQIQQEYIGYYP